MDTARARRAGCVLFVVLHAGLASAAPYRPAQDAQVLERLRAGPAPSLAVSRTSNPQLAAQLARVHIERARRSGDPRDLGYARGVLQPWWNASDAPDAVLLLRATLRQSTHDFDGALTDLDRLLQRDPDAVQAWLTRATILRVQGRYPEAAVACRELRDRADAFVATLCAESVRGLNGGLTAARAALEALQSRLDAQPAGVAAWYRAERAEMALRAGDLPQAEALYREALLRHPDDLDLRAAFADLLLDTERADEALALIPADTEVDTLRLRRALALHALGDPAFAAIDASLREGFAAAHRRGESLHLREEARYRLAVGDDPRLALKLAQRNWQDQREPWDTRLVLAAASAAKQTDAAQPVRDWIAETGYEDARLSRAQAS